MKNKPQIDYDQNKWINENLDRINKSKGGKITFINLSGNSANVYEIDELKYILKSENLAVINQTSGYLLPLGIEVCKCGGWLKWNKKQKRIKILRRIWKFVIGVGIVIGLLTKGFGLFDLLKEKIQNTKDKSEKVQAKQENYISKTDSL